MNRPIAPAPRPQPIQAKPLPAIARPPVNIAPARQLPAVVNPTAIARPPVNLNNVKPPAFVNPTAIARPPVNLSPNQVNPTARSRPPLNSNTIGRPPFNPNTTARPPINPTNVAWSNRYPNGANRNNYNRNNGWNGYGIGLGIAIGVGLSVPLIGTPSYFEPAPIYPEPIPTLALAPSQNNSAPSESGLRIDELVDGGVAKDVDLRPGDVIVGVGKIRVQTFEELKLALSLANGEVDIVFINGESGKLERLPLTPNEGKIGVAVVPVELK